MAYSPEQFSSAIRKFAEWARANSTTVSTDAREALRVFVHARTLTSAEATSLQLFLEAYLPQAAGNVQTQRIATDMGNHRRKIEEMIARRSK